MITKLFGMAGHMFNSTDKIARFAAKEAARNNKVREFIKGGADPFEPDADRLRELAREMMKDAGWTKAGVDSLIKVGKRRELDTIIEYLKSEGAGNLTRFDRAELIHKAMDKLEILQMMKDLF